MAGGMNQQGRGPSISQRSARMREPALDPAVGSDVEPCPVRHCWVADAADRAAEKRPGLLLEWRHGDEGWQGRVAYAAGLRPGGWALVEEWLPASVLVPR